MSACLVCRLVGDCAKRVKVFCGIVAESQSLSLEGVWRRSLKHTLGMAFALEFNRFNKRASSPRFALVTDRSHNEGWDQVRPVIWLKPSCFSDLFKGVPCLC